MFHQHSMRSFIADFGPLTRPQSSVPSVEFIRKRIANSLGEDNILKEIRDLAGKKEVYIGEVTLTGAAVRQIRDMWVYARHPKSGGAPKISLKYFTTGLCRKDGIETVDVEIHPGIDSWEFVYEDMD